MTKLVSKHAVVIAAGWAACLACGGEGDLEDVSTDEAAAVIPAAPPLQPSTPVGTLASTFEVTADGAATMTVPIAVAPGRAGIQAGLALAYSSRSGNGIAGVGWGISGLSQIHRCGSDSFHDGETRPVQFSASDHFCLDGQRLISVPTLPTQSRCTMSPAVEYRTQPESFQRIVACGSDALGPVSWIVYEKTGRLRYYGNDANSRLEVIGPKNNGNGDDGDTVTRRAGWLLARVEDRLGNYMTYTYGRDSASTLEWWPTRIAYTGGVDHVPSLEVRFRYRDDDDDTNTNLPVRADAWTSYTAGVEHPHTRLLKRIAVGRPDGNDHLTAVRSYRLEHRATGRSVLLKISLCDGSGVCLPPTQLAYTPGVTGFHSTHLGSFPNSTTPFLGATDVNGDGRDDLLFTTASASGVVFDHVRLASGTVQDPTFEAATTSRLPNGTVERFPYDARPDGKVDLVSFGCLAPIPTEECTEFGTRTYRHASTGWTSPVAQLTCTAPVGTNPPACLDGIEGVTDLDGDHAYDVARGADIVLSSQVLPNSSLAKVERMVSPIPRQGGTSGSAKFLDIDGDGATDYLVPHGNPNHYDAWHVRGTPAQWHTEATPLAIPTKPGNCQLFADVNGDGLADLVDIESGANVMLNRGDGRFVAADNWARNTAFTGAPICATQVSPAFPSRGWKQASIFPVDYNRDGFQDLLILQPVTAADTVARVLVSNGRAFTLVDQPGIPLNTDSNSDGVWDCAKLNATTSAHVLDANGDGKFDVVLECTTPTGRYTLLYAQTYDAARVAPPETLRDVQDGLGAGHTVRYGVMTDPAVHKNTREWHQPMIAVVSESITDGAGALIEVAQHEYEGGTAALTGEGWLGFRRHTITDPRVMAKRRITYATDDRSRTITGFLGGRPFNPFAGRIVEDVSFVQAGAVVIATRTTRVPELGLESFFLTTGPKIPNYFGYDKSITVETFEASTFDPDAPPAPVTRRVTTVTPDVCGDEVTTTIDRDPGAAIPVKTVTTRSYDPASPTDRCDLVSNWLRITASEKVESFGRDANEAAISQVREIRYTGHKTAARLTGQIRTIERQPSTTGNQARCTQIIQYDMFGSARVVDTYPGACVAAPIVPPPTQQQPNPPLPTPGAATRRVITDRDSQGIHVARVETIVDPAQAAKNHVTQQEVHSGLGVVQVSTDANGISGVRYHDGFGRVVREDSPDGSVQVVQYLLPTHADAAPCLTDSFNAASFKMVELRVDSSGARSLTCRDRRGAVRRIGTQVANGVWAYVDTTYGTTIRPAREQYPERVYRVTRPHAANAFFTALAAQAPEYDATGRVTKTCTAEPMGTLTLVCGTTTYDKLVTTTEDALDTSKVVRKQTLTRFGTVASTSIFDATGEHVTELGYGPFDTLVRVKDAKGNVVKATFDALGRRTKLVDPDTGTTDTTYTAFDQIDTETDARGIKTTMTYDRLGRMTDRSASGDTAVDHVAWDAALQKGRIAQSTRGTVVRDFAYTPAGQLKTTTLTVDSKSFTEDIAYDPASPNRVKSVTEPDIPGFGRAKIVRTYDAVSRPIRLDLVRMAATCTASTQCQTGETCDAVEGRCSRTIWRETELDGEGRTKGEWLGRDPSTSQGVLAVNRGYTGGYLTTLKVQRGSTLLQDDAYTYAKNGNLKTRENKLALGALETFTYDTADQLASATIGSVTQTWKYDSLGNMTDASDARPEASCTTGIKLEYTGARPHAASRVTCPATTVAVALRYDAAGNDLGGLDTRDDFRWTSFGKLAQSTSKVDTWQLSYDAEHNRVMKVRTASVTQNPSPWTKILFGGALERRLKPGGEQAILSIPAGSSTLQLIWDWNGATGTQTLQYTHPDRLGSPELVTNAITGAVIEQRSFDAWGNTRESDMVGAGPSSSKTTISFTGHHDDLGIMIGDSAGFVDMGGRIYSPLLKRFWSPDPFVQAPTNGLSWNRYSYVYNNPLKFTDPTGYLSSLDNFFLHGRDRGEYLDTNLEGFVSDWLQAQHDARQPPPARQTTQSADGTEKVAGGRGSPMPAASLMIFAYYDPIGPWIFDATEAAAASAAAAETAAAGAAEAAATTETSLLSGLRLGLVGLLLTLQDDCGGCTEDQNKPRFLYRTMKSEDGAPKLEASRRGLGLRIGLDFVPYIDKLGNLFLDTFRPDGRPQGLSTALDPRELQPQNKPTWLGGVPKGKTDVLWRIDVRAIGGDLTTVIDPKDPNHVLISPSGPMSLVRFQHAIESTRRQWQVVLPPSPRRPARRIPARRPGSIRGRASHAHELGLGAPPGW